MEAKLEILWTKAWKVSLKCNRWVMGLLLQLWDYVNVWMSGSLWHVNYKDSVRIQIAAKQEEEYMWSQWGGAHRIGTRCAIIITSILYRCSNEVSKVMGRVLSSFDMESQTPTECSHVSWCKQRYRPHKKGLLFLYCEYPWPILRTVSCQGRYHSPITTSVHIWTLSYVCQLPERSYPHIDM